MLTVLIILLLLCIVYLFAVMGRVGHKGLPKLRGWNYAHRGLHGEGVPENSMAAFRAALEAGYGIELDVHLLKDGTLAVMHDSALKRTTGCNGNIEDLTAGQLKDYHLQGTGETIPLFQDVLELYAGKAPLIIELKAAGGNHDALTKAACDMMASYNGVYCVESFDPRCVLWLRKNRPDIIRGQLSENFLATGSNMPWLLKFAMTYNLCNFATQPDFVAYKFCDRNTFSNTLTRKFWNVQGVSWTLRSKEDYNEAVKEGWIPIFENFRP